MDTKSFTINIPDAELVDLKRRLARIRWPDVFDAQPWEYGVPRSVVRQAIEFWRETFDWREAERELNRLPQFKARVRGLEIHFLHVKGVDKASRPLILTHGWPGSFVEMYKLVPLLTDPASHGLSGCLSFDVVIPSLPGFGFSQAPSVPGVGTQVIAEIWHELMAGLGYRKYFVQGGDIGAGVGCWLARQRPDSVLGLHLNFIPGSFEPFIGNESPPLSAAEADWLERRRDWVAREGGYSHLQSTKPETLGFSLSDSPVGLAAWILEKFYAWSDHSDADFGTIDMHEMMTNISVYWFSGNVASTLRIYLENARQPLKFGEGERMRVPLSFAKFPKEILTPPVEWLARVFDIARWTEMKEGGHFAGLEQPRALAREIHASFFR